MNTLTQWIIGGRIGTGFGLVLTIMVAVGAIACGRIVVVERANQVVVGTVLPKLQVLEQIESLVKENFINTSQHVLALEAARKAEIGHQMTAKSGELNDLYKALEAYAATGNEQSAQVTLKSRRAAYREAREAVLALSFKRDPAAAEAIVSSLYPIYTDYVGALTA